MYWDDAYFTMNHFKQIGVVTSETLWAGSGGDVRGIAAGTTSMVMKARGLGHSL